MAERDKSPDEAGKEPDGAGSSAGAGSGGGGRRFRLPRLFANSDEAAAATVNAPAADTAEQDKASVGPASGNIADAEIIATANRPFAGEPRATVLRVPVAAPAAAPTAPRKRGAVVPPAVAPPSIIPPDVVQTPVAQPENAPPEFAPDALLPASSSSENGVDMAPASVATDATLVETAPLAAPPMAAPPMADVSAFMPIPEPSATSQPATSQSYGEFGYIEQIYEEPDVEEPGSGSGSQLLQEIAALRGGMEEMYRTLQEMAEHGQTQDKVFNTLHAELQDYKNDFIYEHLKPVVRSLLFLYDSLEQFDGEMRQHERLGPDERRRGVSPLLVRENVGFFLEQLVEALRICEVMPMPTPEGLFDAQLHKAIDTVEVEAEADNTVQRVVRSGWYLNGRVLRPAEVVIGKKAEDSDSRLWNHGKKVDG